jgi:two-component system CheB/CheR fusion protein
VKRLQAEPAEVQSLAEDLLITVTNYFRDPEVYEKLENTILPKILEGKGSLDTIRVWTVGCATGEEAYSLALLLVEAVQLREEAPRIQIFASDLHKTALDRARRGFFSEEIEADVSPERLKRFFRKESGGYRIVREIRDLVVFTPHNLLSDPPFSRLNLITCRNLLIYLQRHVQRDVIDIFHYALSPGGYLLLGSSETIDTSDLFQAEDEALCIYRRRNVQPPEPRLPVFPLTLGRLPNRTPQAADGSAPVAYGALHARMLDRYAPPSILVSADNKVVHLSERAGRYLVQPGGELTASVFALVRPELRIELRTLLQIVRGGSVPASSQPIAVRFDGAPVRVVIHAHPPVERDHDGFALVVFEDGDPSGESTPPPGRSDDDGERSADLRRLESELDTTRQQLQVIIEDFETGQEEMRASNEELQSANEELRSTMEELETSKEELQSMNEELQTVNQENRHKVEELSQITGDLQNLLAATDIATLFLDRKLRILRFTPKVGLLFNVRMADLGRPVSDLTHCLGYPDLLDDARRVIADPNARPSRPLPRPSCWSQPG